MILSSVKESIDILLKIYANHALAGVQSNPKLLTTSIASAMATKNPSIPRVPTLR